MTTQSRALRGDRIGSPSDPWSGAGGRVRCAGVAGVGRRRTSVGLGRSLTDSTIVAELEAGTYTLEVATRRATAPRSPDQHL